MRCGTVLHLSAKKYHKHRQKFFFALVMLLDALAGYRLCL